MVMPRVTLGVKQPSLSRRSSQMSHSAVPAATCPFTGASTPTETADAADEAAATATVDGQCRNRSPGRRLGDHPGSLRRPVPDLPAHARGIAGALGPRPEPLHRRLLRRLPRDRAGRGALLRQRIQLADEALDGPFHAAQGQPHAPGRPRLLRLHPAPGHHQEALERDLRGQQREVPRRAAGEGPRRRLRLGLRRPLHRGKPPADHGLPQRHASGHAALEPGR